MLRIRANKHSHDSHRARRRRPQASASASNPPHLVVSGSLLAYAPQTTLARPPRDLDRAPARRILHRNISLQPIPSGNVGVMKHTEILKYRCFVGMRRYRDIDV